MRNRSRSFLTGFGIFWGLFMLLFLVGAGDGFKELVAKEFNGFANNTAIIFSSNTSKPYKGYQEGRYWNLDIKDVERLKTMIPELEYVTPEISVWGNRAYRNQNISDVIVKGVSAIHDKVEISRLKYGRYLNEMDVIQERKVCVIGKRIYESLFPDGGDPCGEYIAIGSVFFQVVGVNMANDNININGSNNESAVIPISVAQKLYQRGTSVDIICLVGKENVKMSQLEERTRDILSRAHTFDPSDTEALMCLNCEEIFSIVDNLFKGIKFLIWLIGLGTLLAGAIGVSNIMMVTVRERTSEIGIRRAIGAMPADIMMQIINESITLTSISGTLGILFTVGILDIVGKIAKDPTAFQIDFWTAIMAAVILGVMGILAGIAPARRAMRIKPVDAMKEE